MWDWTMQALVGGFLGYYLGRIHRSVDGLSERIIQMRNDLDALRIALIKPVSTPTSSSKNKEELTPKMPLRIHPRYLTADEREHLIVEIKNCLAKNKPLSMVARKSKRSYALVWQMAKKIKAN